MVLHRDTAAVVLDGDRTIGIDDDAYLGRETGQRLVDGVVNNLGDQVMQPARGDVADVHRRTLADVL